MIFKTLLAQPSEEKLVIIIDEFQYLAKPTKRFRLYFRKFGIPN